MKNNNSLITDLLTENRFWTFSTPDFSKSKNIFWGGKTKFRKVVTLMKKKLGSTEVCYERQVELQNPDIKFS